MVEPFVARSREFFREVLRPIRVPGSPLLMARFGRLALRSCTGLARRFDDAPAQALFAGNAAHSFLPLDAAGSASFGLVLAIAGHAVDWPCARGGSQRIVDALAADARAHGCEIRTGATVRAMDDVPAARAVLFDTDPRQLRDIAGAGLPGWYRRVLGNYRHGPGVFKVDWALDGPVPWTAPACARAGTVHLGATLAEIDSIFYAAFPRVRGRTLDELDDERLRQIGRLIGRMHAVGAARAAPARPRLTVERYVHEPLEVLEANKLLPTALGPRLAFAARCVVL